LNSFGVVFLGEELTGIAEQLGVSLGKVILLQLTYDISTCCTSMVANSNFKDSPPIHIRTMDWDMSYLKDLTINCEFISKGRVIYKTTTWAGYIGALTGMRPGGFSVSVNFRRTNTGEIWTNVKKAIKSSWPIGFLVRHVLQVAGDFNKAVEWFSDAQLIAPCYLTVGGVANNEGIIITRSHNKTDFTWRLGVDGPCIQTNKDVCTMGDNSNNILYSRERYTKARQTLGSDSKVTTDEGSLWRLLSSGYLCNHETIYGTLMCARYSLNSTRLPDAQK
jgi:N-acylethanolamine-hydrolysing acid amidase